MSPLCVRASLFSVSVAGTLKCRRRINGRQTAQAFLYACPRTFASARPASSLTRGPKKCAHDAMIVVVPPLRTLSSSCLLALLPGGGANSRSACRLIFLASGSGWQHARTGFCCCCRWLYGTGALPGASSALPLSVWPYGYSHWGSSSLVASQLCWTTGRYIYEQCYIHGVKKALTDVQRECGLSELPIVPL